MLTTIALLLAVLTLAADAYQTLQIALHPEKWKEVGWAHWLIGENPTPTGALMYFALCIFVCVFVYFLPIPPDGKLAAFVAVAVVEAYTVYKNFKLGIR